MSSKERRILRNRASAERSRKNKDIMIDCLRESIQRHETTINELQIAVSAHPMNYLLTLMPRQMDQQASLTSFPFNEPAVFNI